MQQALALSDEELVGLARNSFDAAFLTEEEKRALVRRVDNYLVARGGVSG